MTNEKQLRAIDLYSGIGGWSLGLKMAGIKVIQSFEWWEVANSTNAKNNNHSTKEVDIRELSLSQVPKNVDIVVGSPPCTQFSYANRGGSGDIADGLKDIKKFLQIVDYVQPKYWAMENVPRVAKILQEEMAPGGCLEEFSYLKPSIHIIDTSEWGVPQRRKRCIAGSFDFSLLFSYSEHIEPKTLGDVVTALAGNCVIDPLYGTRLPSNDLNDHVIEEFLSPEEERMNREMKTYHPVYNNMAFPDPLNSTARTITATCTRVSRESIVIESPENKGHYRRLTVRERGCLQSFPVSYQYYGNSYSQKLKMIGNAVPPLFTFYVAQAMLNRPVNQLITPLQGMRRFAPPSEQPKTTMPDSVGHAYPATRKFRSAIPHLRFKSGVRFELANSFEENSPKWAVSFFYGNSKKIMQFPLNNCLLKRLKKDVFKKDILKKIDRSLCHLETVINSTDAHSLQLVWTHSVQHNLTPYDIVDVMGQATSEIITLLSAEKIDSEELVKKVFSETESTFGIDKVLKHSPAILAGLLTGSHTNFLLNSKTFKLTN